MQKHNRRKLGDLVHFLKVFRLGQERVEPVEFVFRRLLLDSFRECRTALAPRRRKLHEAVRLARVARPFDFGNELLLGFDHDL